MFFAKTFIRTWMGISLIAYFSTIILSKVGTSKGLVQLVAGFLNTSFALGTVPLYFTIERFAAAPYYSTAPSPSLS